MTEEHRPLELSTLDYATLRPAGPSEIAKAALFACLAYSGLSIFAALTQTLIFGLPLGGGLIPLVLLPLPIANHTFIFVYAILNFDPTFSRRRRLIFWLWIYIGTVGLEAAWTFWSTGAFAFAGSLWARTGWIGRSAFSSVAQTVLPVLIIWLLRRESVGQETTS